MWTTQLTLPLLIGHICRQRGTVCVGARRIIWGHICRQRGTVCVGARRIIWVWQTAICTGQLTIFCWWGTKHKAHIFFPWERVKDQLEGKFGAWQENGCCLPRECLVWHEKMMARWIRYQWKPACEGNMLLIADVLRGQGWSNLLGLTVWCNQ